MNLFSLLLVGQPFSDVFDAEPIGRIDAHHVLDEILRLEGDVLREGEPVLLHVDHRLGYFLPLIVALAHQNFVQNRTQRPNIRFFAVLVFNQDLRCHVRGRPDYVRDGLVELLFRQPTESEVTDYRHEAVVVQQNILWFQVPVQDPVLVQVQVPVHQPGKQPHRLFLREAS